MSTTIRDNIASVASGAHRLDQVEEAHALHHNRILNVFLTVDTEVYPITSTWRKDRLRHDVDRDIYGRVETGEYGLNCQLEVLRRYGLKASFFVEPLFALSSDVGEEPLRRIVREIQDAGQEVQMHLHPEWVPELPLEIASRLTERKSDVLNRFSAADQATLIRIGLGTLRRCGARNIRAFRAGDYAADRHTLRALHEVGLEFDTSYNYCYLKSLCGLHTHRPVVQPMRMEGLWEIPITFFQDWPGHSRHTQLGACSSAEIIRALENAKRAGWWSFVLVSHSFEGLKNRRSSKLASVRPQVVARFERLCAYLDRHRDRFRTAHFAAIDSRRIPPSSATVPLRGRVTDSVRRLVKGIL
jgi:hypothetical protein